MVQECYKNLQSHFLFFKIETDFLVVIELKKKPPKYFKNPSRTSISCSVDMCVVNLVEIERVVFSDSGLETYRQAFSKTLY